MSGRLEQVYLSSDSRLDLPGEEPLFELDFNKWCKMWALFQSLPGPLVRYGTGVNHYQMWLNIVIKFVKIPYLLTSKKVEGSLSKLLCMSKDNQRYSNVCNVKKKYLFTKSLRVYLSSHP